MDKSFDDLSDEFLNEDSKKPEVKKKKKNKLVDKSNELPPEILGLIDVLNNIQSGNHINIEDQFDLGEPDTHETNEDDNQTFDKKTWETDFGTVTRITIGGDNIFENNEGINSLEDLLSKIFNPSNKKIHPLSLEDELKIAVDNEDYVKAAELRDKINNSKK